MEYNGEKVLKAIRAIICSYDEDEIPTCICTLYLTEHHVYASEKHYDGTQTNHMIIDINKIKQLVIENPYMSSYGSDMRDEGEASTNKKGFGLFSMLFSAPGSRGIFGISDRNGESNGVARCNEYLLIEYEDDFGKIAKMYFEPVEGYSIKSFVNSYKKLMKKNS